MDDADIAVLVRDGMLVMLKLGGPPLLAALVVGLLVALLLAGAVFTHYFIGEGAKDNAPGLFLGDKLGTWTYDDLNTFLSGPQAYVSGTKMTFVGLKKQDTRINVIAYLRSLSASPAPIPPPAAAAATAAAKPKP